MSNVEQITSIIIELQADQKNSYNNYTPILINNLFSKDPKNIQKSLKDKMFMGLIRSYVKKNLDIESNSMNSENQTDSSKADKNKKRSKIN